MWIGSKHRVRWLTAGDSMKKAICHFGPLRRTNVKTTRTSPFDLPTAGHAHLSTLNYAHDIPKHACMTSMQLPRTSHSAGHSAGRGRHTSALYKERCMSLHQHAYMHKSFPISRTPRCGQIRGAGKMRYAQRWYTRACVWRKGGDGLGLHIDTIT